VPYFFLGRSKDSELTWKKHVAKLISKQEGKNWYNQEGKEHFSINNIYKELVQPGFDYCDGVYDSMSKTLATELRTLQDVRSASQREFITTAEGGRKKRPPQW